MNSHKTSYTTLSFMAATASVSEIATFSLRKGDVLITKDSETPDDIGVPAVVNEELDNVICGYHLAIIRPNQEKINSIFLAMELGSARAARHFSSHANGATRFGLSTSAVMRTMINVPSIEEQKRIAAILYVCDREIELLTRRRNLLQKQKKGLMQKLLTGEVRVETSQTRRNQ